ncbi:hypothetical protein OIO90_000359 [Microbotryomycetes sp. JL221]|nr:hypothetical protein OIO90_000359 [Microbotryomycetes sp. JL221]
MPDRKVADTLPDFLRTQRERSTQESKRGLEDLTILCRESPVMSDRILRSCIPHLDGTGLRSLSLAGCSRLSGAPVLELLPKLPRLEHLALEATNVDPRSLAQFAPCLRSILSLKLTHPGPAHPCESSFFDGLSTIFAQANKLEAFTIYHSGAGSTGSRHWPVLPLSFVEALTSSGVAARLVKFECSNILVPLDSIDMLCPTLVRVKDLVIHVPYNAGPVLIDHLAVALSRLCQLKTLHILSQYPDVEFDRIVWLASQCSPTLKQLGLRNRVWHVERTRQVQSEDGTETKQQRFRLIETAEAFGAFKRNRYGAEEDAEPDVSESEDEQ